MITARTFPQENGHLMLVFEGPKKVEPIEALSIEDAQRIVDFQNRKYILEKLVSWLHQRRHAIALAGGETAAEKLKVIQTIEMGLGYRRHASLRNICLYLNEVNEDFSTLIPPVSSSHFKIYFNTIHHIMQFATGKDTVPD